MHTLQTNYIHQVIQARLVENQNALSEVYNCLHFFCQSLQLEVLYTQTLRLMMDRLDENVHVDEYVPGAKLTISYWRYKFIIEYFYEDLLNENIIILGN